MRVILDATDPDDQPTVNDVRLVLDLLQQDGRPIPILGVNDAGHGNVLLARLREAGVPCERWFQASCGMRRQAD